MHTKTIASYQDKIAEQKSTIAGQKSTIAKFKKAFAMRKTAQESIHVIDSENEGEEKAKPAKIMECVCVGGGGVRVRAG